MFDVNDALALARDVDLVKTATGNTESVRTTALKVVDVFNKANMIRDPSSEAPWIPVGPLASMGSVIPVLCTHAKRVPVVDDKTGRVIKMISQMDVVRAVRTMIVSRRQSEWPQVLAESPESTSIGLRPVVSITEENEARDAFKLIVDEKVSCVAVLDDAGVQIGAISNKDLNVVMRGEQQKQTKMAAPMMAAAPSRNRGRFSIAASTMSDKDYFGMPAMMFVNEAQMEMQRNRKAGTSFCSASPHTSFKDLIEKIDATGHHRVFLVDDDNRPVGVVSIGDICKLIDADMHPKEEVKEKSPSRAPPPIPKRQ
jgi:CBS domain-containing protein